MIAKWFRRFRAERLTRRACDLARKDEPQAALSLLQLAIRIDASYGLAHHECARLYRLHARQIDQAEAAVRQALQCDPRNPDYQNTLFEIQIDRARPLRVRAEISARLEACLAALQEAIAADPAHPAFHITRARALALGGKPESQWQPELDAAWKLHAAQPADSPRRKRTQAEVDCLLATNRTACEELARCWKNLAEV